jgi:ApaG protein
MGHFTSGPRGRRSGFSTMTPDLHLIYATYRKRVLRRLFRKAGFSGARGHTRSNSNVRGTHRVEVSSAWWFEWAERAPQVYPQSWLIPRLCSNLLFMADRIPYKAITRGIAVSVVPTYLEADSSPSNSHYLWAYSVTIENQGRETVKLLSRHWMITNAHGELTEVRGSGVIGKQPVLKPGESHEYTSGASLNTPVGDDGWELPDGKR